MTLNQAKQIMKQAGYVCIKEKSYYQAQERQRVAEARQKYAEEERDHTLNWARNDLIPEIRHLNGRCTFLYGQAMKFGASRDDLKGNI